MNDDTKQSEPLLTRQQIEGGAMVILNESRAGAGLEAIKAMLDDLVDIVEDGIEQGEKG